MADPTTPADPEQPGTPPTPQAEQPEAPAAPELPPLGPTHRRPAGRPGKLTDELTEEICKGLRAGAYIETAAAYVGVAKQQLYSWMRRGVADAKTPNRSGSVYVRFHDAIGRALAEGEMRSVLRMDKAAGARVEKTTTTTTTTVAGVTTTQVTETSRPVLGDWRADAWRLERKFPERYGQAQRIKIAVDSQVDEVLEKLKDELPPETYRQVLVALSRVAEEGAEEGDGEASADPAGEPEE